MTSTVLAGCAVVIFTGLLAGEEKPRIFITESGSVVSGDTEMGNVKGSMSLNSGTSPNNIDVMRAFQRHCPGVAITSNREKAEYIVRFDHEAINPTTAFVRGNKVAVFDRKDELVYTNSTRLLTNAVKGACGVLTRTAAR